MGNANDGHIASADLLPARDLPGEDALQLILGDVDDWVVAMNEHADRVVADDLVVEAPLLLIRGQRPGNAGQWRRALEDQVQTLAGALDLHLAEPDARLGHEGFGGLWNDVLAYGGRADVRELGGDRRHERDEAQHEHQPERARPRLSHGRFVGLSFSNSIGISSRGIWAHVLDHDSDLAFSRGDGDADTMTPTITAMTTDRPRHTGIRLLIVCPSRLSAAMLDIEPDPLDLSFDAGDLILDLARAILRGDGFELLAEDREH